MLEPWLAGERVGRAYGWFEPGGSFVLEKIEVDRAQRSKGYGSAVLAQLRAKARERGCREFVIKGVRTTNRRAIALYESLGAVPGPASAGLVTYVIAPP